MTTKITPRRLKARNHNIEIIGSHAANEVIYHISERVRIVNTLQFNRMYLFSFSEFDYYSKRPYWPHVQAPLAHLHSGPQVHELIHSTENF